LFNSSRKAFVTKKSAKNFSSRATVKNHLHNIFDKLGVSDAWNWRLYAIHHRLIDHT